LLANPHCNSGQPDQFTSQVVNAFNQFAEVLARFFPLDQRIAHLTQVVKQYANHDLPIELSAERDVKIEPNTRRLRAEVLTACLHQIRDAFHQTMFFWNSDNEPYKDTYIEAARFINELYENIDPSKVEEEDTERALIAIINSIYNHVFPGQDAWRQSSQLRPDKRIERVIQRLEPVIREVSTSDQE